MPFYIVDVSRYNGPIDFEAVKNAGIKGVVCKTTEGTVDQTSAATYAYFAQTCESIKSLNFPIRGGYHYLRHGNIRPQVLNFVSTLRLSFGSIEGLTIQLDAEDASLTLADVRTWIDEWNSATNSYPILGYFPRWFWEGKGVVPSSLLKGVAGWWQSAYVVGAGQYADLADKIVSGWNTWGSYAPTILQYSSTAFVSGDPGFSDINQIRMSLDMFLKQCTRQPVIPVPAIKDDVMAKLVQAVGDNRIFLHYTSDLGRVLEHVQTMDEVANLKLIYGQTVSVPTLTGLGTIIEAPSIV